MKRKYVWIILLALLVVGGVVYTLCKTDEIRESTRVEIALTVRKDDIAEFIKEKSPYMTFIIGYLPEKTELSAELSLTGEKDNPVKVSKLCMNGYEVSGEVLSEICEKFLDFRCSLVYN